MNRVKTVPEVGAHDKRSSKECTTISELRACRKYLTSIGRHKDTATQSSKSSDVSIMSMLTLSYKFYEFTSKFDLDVDMMRMLVLLLVYHIWDRSIFARTGMRGTGDFQ
jgi:hypothetical protein